MQGELSAADNEQISWSHNGNAFYLSHYHTFCHDQRAGGCYNNYSATASTDLYGWTASPGYSYTRSVQRFWQLPEMASVTFLNGNSLVRTSDSTSDSQYSSSGVLMTLGTSINYRNWNIWPRIGMFSNRISNKYQNDTGVFLTLSLSGNTQVDSGVNRNTTATWIIVSTVRTITCHYASSVFQIYRIFDLWISFCQEGGILGAHLLAGNGMLPWETAVWLPVTATIRSITTGP
ncbi:TPA: hypothetical protein ACOP2N_004627 [Salmonella enterica]|nr:hypothetical protein [Salmonella enterica subsp. enterica serovar Kinondoni]EJB9810973.1 hypothetical protein [Salmonella enterica]